MYNSKYGYFKRILIAVLVLTFICAFPCNAYADTPENHRCNLHSLSKDDYTIFPYKPSIKVEGNCTSGNGICQAYARGWAYVYLEDDTPVFSGYAWQCTNCYTVYATEYHPASNRDNKVGRYTYYPYHVPINTVHNYLWVDSIFYAPGRTIPGVTLIG